MRSSIAVFFTAACLVAAGLTAAGCQCRGSGDKKAGDRRPDTARPGQSEQDLQSPLAEIDDVVITVGEFQERIGRQSPYVRARYTSLEQKREFLDTLVRFEVLALEAEKRGFAADPDVVRTVKQVMVQKLMTDEFAKIGPESISEEQMRRFYDEHKDEFNKPEEVRVSAIILAGKSRAEEVARLARGEAGNSNKGFRDLVTQYSEDEGTKIRGGDLRYFARNSAEVPRPVIDAAFALAQTGDVAGPIRVDEHTYYIIRQTGRRDAIHRDFDAVKRQISHRMVREMRNNAQREFIESIKAKARIKVYEDRLAGVRIDGAPLGRSPGSPAAPAAPGLPGHEHPGHAGGNPGASP